MKALAKRLTALESKGRALLRLPLVWVRPDQSKEQALEAAGLPAGAPNGFLVWKDAQ